MDLSQLLPDHFQLIDHTIGETAIHISLIATQTVGLCPACQMPTNRVHSFYRTGGPAAHPNGFTHLRKSRSPSASSAKVRLSK